LCQCWLPSSRAALAFAEAQLYGPSNAISRRKWWLDRNRILPALLRLKNDLENRAATYHSLMSLVGHADRLSRQLTHIDRLDLTKKHYYLSCYCFGLSRLCQTAHRPTDGLILLHRSIDLYFQHLGLQEKLIVVSAEGLRYADDPQERTIVTLMEYRKIHDRLWNISEK
jgi:hypothetical protein